MSNSEVISRIVENAAKDGIAVTHSLEKIFQAFGWFGTHVSGVYLSPKSSTLNKIGLRQETILLNPKIDNESLSCKTYILFHELAHATGIASRCDRPFFRNQDEIFLAEIQMHEEEFIADEIALIILHRLDMADAEVTSKLISHQLPYTIGLAITDEIRNQIKDGVSYFIEKWIEPNQQSEKAVA